jgi:hypothetical protein
MVDNGKLGKVVLFLFSIVDTPKINS